MMLTNSYIVARLNVQIFALVAILIYMATLRLSDTEAYRNPGGWVEFWVGLIVMIFFSLYCGRIIYMEEMVKQGDAAYRQSVFEKIDEN